MNELQIKQIADTVEASNIASAELKVDLIDHLCCMVEDEMSKGKEFETAYREALQRFCPNGLDEIQNETVFLMPSKSRKRLNRLMYVSGFAALTGILVTIIMKMLNMPFNALLFTISIFVAVLIFFPVLFIRLLTPKSKKILDRIMYISGFLALLGILLHVVKKMLDVNFGGVPLMFISFFVAVFFFFPAFLVRLLKQTYDKQKKTFIFGFTGAWLLVISAMFAQMHWPGMFVFLLIAIVCICISVFPLKSSKNPNCYV